MPNIPTVAWKDIPVADRPKYQVNKSVYDLHKKLLAQVLPRWVNQQRFDAESFPHSPNPEFKICIESRADGLAWWSELDMIPSHSQIVDIHQIILEKRTQFNFMDF